MSLVANGFHSANGSNTASHLVQDRYRGAVVEVWFSFISVMTDYWTLSKDLQLQPAFALPSEEPISRAIELAYERDFSQIPYV